VGSKSHTEDEGEDCPTERAQGSVPSTSITTGRSGYIPDQPNSEGVVNYFRVGNSSECFGYIKDWVEKRIRRHLMRA